MTEKKPKSVGRPQRVSVTLVDGKENVLVVRTEKQTDESYKSVVIHLPKDGERKRGMSALHETFKEALERVEELAEDAKKNGWRLRKKVRAKPDEFGVLPRAR